MNASRLFQSLVLVAALSVAACTPETFRGTDIRGVDWGPDFELTAHTGKRFNSVDRRGTALVLFFGYTHCPDICAPTLAKLAQAIAQLGDTASHVQVLFITVDPRHDTAAQLADFVPKFHPSFIGLTGTEAQLRAVARGHRVPFESSPNNPALFNHSGTVLVKDMQGKPRLLWRDEISAEDMAQDLRLLLQQG